MPRKGNLSPLCGSAVNSMYILKTYGQKRYDSDIRRPWRGEVGERKSPTRVVVERTKSSKNLMDNKEK